MRAPLISCDSGNVDGALWFPDSSTLVRTDKDAIEHADTGLLVEKLEALVQIAEVKFVSTARR
jgi:hypothetical protein